MIELSLFTGAGGGLLATSHLMGWTCVGAVEIDEYCCEILERRRDEGFLDSEMEIWQMDIREFNTRVAQIYQGKVDVLTAGFPCQPFSVAGKRLGADDERNMWPATIDCIRRVRPRYCFLENVPGLLAGSHGYFGHILGELAESGYSARWRVLSAAEVGAPHKGDRLWIVAATTGHGFETNWFHCTDAQKGQREPQIKRCKTRVVCCTDDGDRVWGFPDAEIQRKFDDVADWVDQFRAIGNGQVPIVAATAWRLLGDPRRRL